MCSSQCHNVILELCIQGSDHLQETLQTKPHFGAICALTHTGKQDDEEITKKNTNTYSHIFSCFISFWKLVKTSIVRHISYLKSYWIKYQFCVFISMILQKVEM